MTLACLGPFSHRLIALSWDGVKFQRELDPAVPRNLPVELILRDLQLVYWPAEVIRRALPSGWELKLKAGTREYINNGKEVIEVRYAGDRFKDPIEFEHKAAEYKLVIHTLESADE